MATLEQHLPRLETDGTYLEEGTPWQGLQEGRVLQDKSQSVCKGSQQKRNKWPAELILEFYLLSIFSVAPGFAGPGEWPTTGTPFLYHEVRTPMWLRTPESQDLWWRQRFKVLRTEVSHGPILGEAVLTATSKWLSLILRLKV